MKEAVKHSATNNHQHKPFFDKAGSTGMFGDSHEATTESFFQQPNVKPAGFGGGGGNIIQKKDAPPLPPKKKATTKPGAKKGSLTSAKTPLLHFDLHQKEIKGGGSITIVSSAIVTRVAEVMHTRITSTGIERLPYEYSFQYHRKVIVKTADGETATMTMDANNYLPFAEVDGKTSLSLKEAQAMNGDFNSIKWSIQGAYNKDKYGKSLKAKHGIGGVPVTINGKTEEVFVFDEFGRESIVKADSPRTAVAMPDLVTKAGPAFLKFNLTDPQQFQTIVDYMNSMLGQQLDAEYDLSKKKNKKSGDKDEPAPPAQEPEGVVDDSGDATGKVVENAAELPGWMKAIGNFFGSIGAFFSRLWNKLPPWARGILKAVGVAALFIAGTVLIAALIVAAVPTLTIGAVVGTIAALAFAFSFGFSLGTRWRQSKSVKEFFWSIPVAIFDAIGITGIYESITGSSIFNGDDIQQNEEDRWYNGTSGFLTLLGTIFGARSWAKKPKLPAGGADPVPPGRGGDPVPPSAKGGGGSKKGFFEKLKDWFSKSAAKPTSKSKKSLLDFLERVWKDREAIRKNDKQVYDLYAQTTEPNPLKVKSEQQYTIELEQMKKGKTNVGDVKSRKVNLADATDVLFEQQGDTASGFTHFYRRNGILNPVKERIYLNVKADEAPQIMQKIMNDVIARPDKYPGVVGGKVSGAKSVTGRPDAIIIYMEDSKAAQQVLGYVNGLKKGNPSAFMETTPPMTSEVSPGVSRANEPAQTPGGDNQSFGQSRSDAITEALNNTVNKNGTKEDFITEVERVFSKEGIDPENPHLNQ